MKYKIITALFFLLFSLLLQAEISISVDRSPIVVDELFQLIFESNDKVDGEPDFSPLNKSFTVLNTARHSSIQRYNGRTFKSKKWILTILANQAGTLPVPAIHFGKDVSRATSINVIANAPSEKGKNTGDIFVTAEVNINTPYVQEQVIYTVKLYSAVQTNNASLSEPEVSGGQAVINKLGEDKSFETPLNGKRYSVIQRQYVIFPQSSGELKITPLVFQGQTGSGGFFGFNSYGQQPKLIVKRSEAIQLDIKPVPDSFRGDTWLPASQLSIQEQWSIDPGKLQQGEAATRTLTLTANGLVASHLPAVDNYLPEKLKQYPDQPEFEETNNKNGFVGIRHDKMAIIPTEAGDYILPAIKIPWWNTDTDKMEIAELPERTIHAAASVIASASASPNNIQQRVIENEATPVDEALISNNVELAQPLNNETPWKWFSLLLFVLWIITIYIFWKKNHKPVSSNSLPDKELSSRQYLKQLKQACVANEAVKTKKALLDWANTFWPDKKITSINAIKGFCEKDLQLKIDELNTCLYGKESSQWNGTDFLRSFESQSFEHKKSEQTKGNLEPLNKI